MESKLKASQREAEEIKDIMRDNLNKVEEREVKLEDLDKRGAELLKNSQKFKKRTKEVRHKKRNDYLRSKAGLIAVVAVLALVIIIVLVAMFSSTSSSDTTVQTAAEPPKSNISKHS